MRRGQCWWVGGNLRQCHTVSRVTLGHAGTMTDGSSKHAAIWPGLTVLYCNISTTHIQSSSEMLFSVRH